MIDLSKYLNVYEFDETLPGSGQKVKIRPYSAADLKRLMLNVDEETSLDNLLSACVVSEGFNIDDLYLQDRQYLLVSLRRLTKGTTYEYVYTCPKCYSQRITIVDLKKMKVKKIPKDFSNKVKLDDNISVELKPITRGAIKEAVKIIDNIEKDNQTDLGAAKTIEQVMLIYALSIIKIITPEGEYSPTKEEAIEFINNEKLPRQMFEKIGDWFKTLDYGLDLTLNIACDNKKCSEVGKEIKEDLQLGDFLF
jgi:hypothetical protein